MPCDPQRSFSSAFGWDGGLLRFSPAPSDQRGSFPRHSPAFHTAPSFAAEGLTCLSCKFLLGHAAFCRYRVADVTGKPEREAGDSRIPFQKVRKPLNKHLCALLPAGGCHQERIPAVPGQEESPVRIRQLPKRCSRQEQCLCLPDASPDRGVRASLPYTMWAGSASRRSISSCLGSQSPSSVKPDMAHCSLEVRLPCGIVKAAACRQSSRSSRIKSEGRRLRVENRSRMSGYRSKMSARTMFVKALAVSFRYANTGIGSSSFTWGAATAGAVGWTMTGACLLFRTFIRGSGFRVPRQSPLLLVRIPQRPAPCECHPGMRRRPLPGLVPRKYPLPLPDFVKKAAEILRSLLSAFVLRAAKKSP